jgi:hypothetical protein
MLDNLPAKVFYHVPVVPHVPEKIFRKSGLSAGRELFEIIFFYDVQKISLAVQHPFFLQSLHVSFVFFLQFSIRIRRASI